jgi:hypothetical protein
MNSSPENQDPIRKLLALKRYEQPPPGYFESFSQKVIARIEAQSASTALPWWRQWFAGFAEQPLLASTYGMLFVGLLVVAVGLAQSSTEDDSNLSLSVGLSPLGSYSYSLREEMAPSEIPLRPVSENTTLPSNIRSVSSPFLFLPVGSVEPVGYQP